MDFVRPHSISLVRRPLSKLAHPAHSFRRYSLPVTGSRQLFTVSFGTFQTLQASVPTCKAHSLLVGSSEADCVSNH